MTFPEGYKINIFSIPRVVLKSDVELNVKYLDNEAAVQVIVFIRKLLQYYRHRYYNNDIISQMSI